jgi:A/G-specific adenine glycosylase
MTSPGRDIAGRVVRWQASHGRSSLPWQNTRDPYRVWLSEIMLQQTQVKTVLGYYDRFLQRCPDVASLAAASLDEVLGLWSGLGYYSRARNLHRCAQAVVERHGGRFPASAAQLEQLPGIGRSTAAAIAAFCWDERAAILDGNVKRVLTRALAFDQDLAQQAAERTLWQSATELLPERAADMPAYTQGLMDLGATICLARNPSCLLCPLESVCEAKRMQTPQAFPVKTRKLRRTAESLWLLQAKDGQGAVWLEKRPTPGVWGGLYCLPVFESREQLAAALPARTRERLEDGPAFRHVLTHKDLYLHPVAIEVKTDSLRAREGS